MKEFIETGKIVAVQGLKGEVRAEAWCDDPAFLAGLKRVRVGSPENEVDIERARPHKQRMAVIKLRGVDTPEAAGALRGKLLYVHRSQIPLEEGEYLIQDLLACTVFDADTGEEYGPLCDVSHTGANDVWHIRFPDGSEKLLPVIPQVVKRVDVAAGRVEITPLEGLFT